MMSDLSDLYDSCAQCGQREMGASNITQAAFKVCSETKCGHKFCAGCIKKEFATKSQFKCRKCGVSVTQKRLSEKTQEEAEVERDNIVRRRLLSIFNKQQYDFDTLLQYNNYLDMVEDYIYNIVHGIETEKTESEIREYEKKNLKEIAERQFRKKEDDERQQRKMIEEEAAKQARLKELHDLEKQERLLRKEYTRQTNELMLGQRDEITVSAPKSRSITGSSEVDASSTASVTAPNHVLTFFSRRPEPLPMDESTTMTTDKKQMKHQYQSHSVRLAGGYENSLFEKRNLQEIFGCMQFEITKADNNNKMQIS